MIKCGHRVGPQVTRHICLELPTVSPDKSRRLFAFLEKVLRSSRYFGVAAPLPLSSIGSVICLDSTTYSLPSPIARSSLVMLG